MLTVEGWIGGICCDRCVSGWLLQTANGPKASHVRPWHLILGYQSTSMSSCAVGAPIFFAQGMDAVVSASCSMLPVILAAGFGLPYGSPVLPPFIVLILCTGRPA